MSAYDPQSHNAMFSRLEERAERLEKLILEVLDHHRSSEVRISKIEHYIAGLKGSVAVISLFFSGLVATFWHYITQK